ncbi:hypothetical protein [Paenibacillus physcomitrellae]|uniref:DUF3221 domain-containing protein n=1 Tax=Paenibacillus physcomitrellae TaxID=1619311 RepID=A0ABQ1FPF5_9BACL|nr:hypothetical protein [Paenibacillus physcomitrellae]GGA25017.1 hypothetical protein GCM10010917_07400 [Paenibacillus physcomitrellae]
MLFSSVKHLLWTAISLSLFIAACTAMLRGVEISDNAVKASSTVNYNQALNIYVHSEEDRDEVSLFAYTGAQVLYMWRNSLGEDVRITVNGMTFPKPQPYSDPEWTAPANGIRLEQLYTAAFEYNDLNQVKEISFTAQ